MTGADPAISDEYRVTKRPFPAFFAPAEVCPAREPGKTLDSSLGWMLYDVFDLCRSVVSDGKPVISLFQAKIKQGVLDVPDFSSADVRKPVRRG